jgi:hypothetical protein
MTIKCAFDCALFFVLRAIATVALVVVMVIAGAIWLVLWPFTKERGEDEL